MKIKEIRLQNADSGAGIVKDPVIAWKFEKEAGGRYQISCRIRIMDGEICIYDSGVIMTDRQNGHKCHVLLQTHTRYCVTVEVTDDVGVTETGRSAPFLSGMAEGEEWKGRWISNQTGKPQYLGKSVKLKKKIRFAAVSAAGVGQYELCVNGKKPDGSVLNGSWTEYRRHIHYQTWEITGLLWEGENDLLLELGNGWYCEEGREERYFYTLDKGYEKFGSALAGIASFTVVYEDGTKEEFGTDTTWWSSASETVYTNAFGAEDYDARLEGKTKREGAAVLPQEKAPKGKLIPMLYPPVKIRCVYEGNFLKRLDDGSELYDMGQNMSGLIEIEVKGGRGTKVVMFPAEKLDFDRNPWKTTDSWCSYTLKGQGRERWRPKFTYEAGRYLLLSPAPDSERKEMPEILGVKGYAVTSAAEDTGRFYCSDHRYMQIHDLILRAVESNLHHVHTDCPTIERLGWQEQNHLMAPSVFYVKNAETLWDKIAMDERDGQYREGEADTDLGAFPYTYGKGLLPSVAPRYARFLYAGGEGSFWDIPPWGSSILLAAFEQYRFTGSRETLAENYDAAAAYVEYLYGKYRDYGKLYGKDESICFLKQGLGDWGIEQNRGESRENIETAYLYRDLAVLAETAKWLEKGEDAEKFLSLSQKVLESYNQLLLVKNPQTGEWAYDSYDKTGLTVTQAAQAIPLQFGMVPQEKRDSVIISFLRSCEEHRIKAGEIGLPYILRTLGDLKRADIVHDMILQKYHPSYYRFIEQGETTMPEFWRDDSRSRNHDMMGSILEWFYRYLAGISSEDGFATIRIAPVLPEPIASVVCSYEAITGTVEVKIGRIGDSQVRIEACIPVNTRGSLMVGANEIPLKGGLTCIWNGESSDFS